MLTGYGKGRWAQLTPKDDYSESTELMFTIHDMSDTVILNNSVMTVTQALEGKPDPRLQYHRLSDLPGSPGTYKITQDFRAWDVRRGVVYGVQVVS